MGFRKGTGFTNINRVLQANRGSKLGQTVAGGITGQVNKVNTGVQTAKESFDKKAEENRLDTDTAKQQRDQTLGKFDQAAGPVDESKFAVSSGLQSDYEKRKTATSGQIDTEKKASTESESRLNTMNQQIKDNDALYQYNRKMYGSGAKINKILTNTQSALIQKRNAEQAQFDNLKKNLYGIEQELSGIDQDFQSKSSAEKAAFIDSEQRRMQQELLPTEQELSTFNKFTTGAYSGPTELEDTGSLIAQAQQAESLGRLARTPGGNQELLRQFVGGRDYTSGQRKLDQTILGQDKSINLGAATRQTRGLLNSVTDASRGASAKAQEFTNRAKAFGDETKSLIETKQTPLISQLDERVSGIATAEAQKSEKYNKIQSILKGTDYAGVDPTRRANIALEEASRNGLISPEEMTKLSGAGGIIDQAKSLGIDPSALLSNKLQNVASQNVTRSGIATGGENLRLDLLNKLLGRQNYENEFSGTDRFQAGRTGFDLSGIEDFIARTKLSDENMKEKIKYDSKDIQSFLDRLKPASYDYKDKVKDDPRASKDRQIGVMAQDLEKSKLGKEAVSEGDIGKIVDYKDLEPKMLASLAALNQRLKKIEGKK